MQLLILKVKKKAIIRNQYNQVPHLTRDTYHVQDHIGRKVTKKAQETYRKETKPKKTSHTREPRGQPFPASDHKAARNRQDINNKKETQKEHCRGTVSKKNYWRA